LLHVFFTSSGKLIKKTLDDLCLTTTGESNEDWRVVDLDKLFQKE
jgi:hypothetical protein